MAGRWDEGGRWQWGGLGRRKLLKIYLSNYALLRANIKIGFNSLSAQQLRNMLGPGDAGPGFYICLGQAYMDNSNSKCPSQSGCPIVHMRRVGGSNSTALDLHWRVVPAGEPDSSLGIVLGEITLNMVNNTQLSI